MTRHTHTVTETRCDGRLATACDPAHPDRPHTCPASITTQEGVDHDEAVRVARWSTVHQDDHLRHYCPTHREQGLPDEHTVQCRSLDNDTGRCICRDLDAQIDALHGPGAAAAPDAALADGTVYAENLPRNPCPECAAGKHPNCNGETWNDRTDSLGPCPCAARSHQ